MKLFLGMCSGVGKTHTMLQDAIARHADGVDVVVGCVDTRQRPETERLRLSLPQLAAPAGSSSRHDADFDLDRALSRRPKLLLMDDLTRRNATGARHVRRYQDALELLEAGIDVYATVNVQQVESRADAASQITGLPVLETVPDSLIDRADEIELIDVSPDELLKRLADGKVVPGAGMDAESAAVFYRKGNLTALREMALRLTAEHVDRQLREYMRAKGISGPWPTHERLLAAIDGRASGERVIRWTHRLAFHVRAPWMVVYVETHGDRNQARQANVESQLELARTLGADVVVTNDDDAVAALMRIARQQNVTQIIIGKPAHRNPWQRWVGSSTADRLLEEAVGLDICVAAGEDSGHEVALRTPPLLAMSSPAGEYVRVAALTIVAAAACWPFRDLLGYQSIALLLLFAVLLMALRFRRGPTLLAGTISALTWNFLFIPPIFTLAIHSLENVLMFFTYFAVAMVAGHLTTRVRERDQMMRVRESQAIASFELARDLSEATTMSDVLQVAQRHVRLAFATDAELWQTNGEGRITPASPAMPAPSGVEIEAATWALEHGSASGRYTGTIAHAERQYHPLVSPTGAIAVLGLRLADRLSTPQQELLASFTRQIAIAIERERLDEAAQQQKMVRESERLSRTILNLVSHELRTPITAIRGAASSILDPGVDAVSRDALGHSIVDSASRLNQLVENVLDMSRLESGTLRLSLDWVDVHDLVQVVEQRARNELESHQFTVDMQTAPALPLLRLDFSLMEHVLWNLLGNAARHTPPGTNVTLRVRSDGKCLELAVIDTGPGMPSGELSAAFDRFHRVNGRRSGGLGLGLSICKGLVEAHGGGISAHNERNGGFAVTIWLPVQDAPALPMAEADES